MFCHNPLPSVTSVIKLSPFYLYTVHLLQLKILWQFRSEELLQMVESIQFIATLRFHSHKCMKLNMTSRSIRRRIVKVDFLIRTSDYHSNWRSVQGVPRLSPEDCWDRLQPPRDPTDGLSGRKWMDGWTTTVISPVEDVKGETVNRTVIHKGPDQAL